MATSLTGPYRATDMAFSAAPVPRPPAPIRAAWTVLSSAAWTSGTVYPANADAAARDPVAFRTSRRDGPRLVGSDTSRLLPTEGVVCGRRAGCKVSVADREAESTGATPVTPRPKG